MIKLKRREYEKNGYKNHSYYVEGDVNGRMMSALFVAQDKGGYQILDLIFDGKDEVDLIVTPFEIKDDKGKVVKGKTFSARIIDKNGKPLELKVKPYRPSDVAIINNLVG